MLTMLDLFSGIGGISLGAEMTGKIKTVGFCEIEPFCQKVLRKHWPDVPIYPDIKELSGSDIGAVDIIAGGYPCQPFSKAGKRRGEDDDRYLWPEYLRLITELMPHWVVGENVANHIHLGLDQVLSDLEGTGYTGRAFIIPACSQGAGHRRERVFVVAHSGRLRLLDSRVEEFSTKRWEQTFYESIRCSWWNSEPQIRRVVDGVPTKLDKSRLKALGNAVVPQQIFPIFWAISQLECGRDAH